MDQQSKVEQIFECAKIKPLTTQLIEFIAFKGETHISKLIPSYVKHHHIISFVYIDLAFS